MFNLCCSEEKPINLLIPLLASYFSIVVVVLKLFQFCHHVVIFKNIWCHSWWSHNFKQQWSGEMEWQWQYFPLPVHLLQPPLLWMWSFIHKMIKRCKHHFCHWYRVNNKLMLCYYFLKPGAMHATNYTNSLNIYYYATIANKIL